MPGEKPAFPFYLSVVLPSSTFSPSYPQWSRMKYLALSAPALHVNGDFASAYLQVSCDGRWEVGAHVESCEPEVKDLALWSSMRVKDYRRGKGKFQKVLWKLTYEKMQILLSWIFFNWNFRNVLDCVIVPKTIYRYLNSNTILPKLIDSQKPLKLCMKKIRH